MVERKKTEKEKKSVQVKATTGAWWKSKPEEETVETPVTPKEITQPVKPKRTPRPKKAVTPKVTASDAVPPKKTRRATTPKAAKAATDATVVAPVAVPDVVDAPTTPAAKKAAPKKRVTKPRTPKAKVQPAEKKASEIVKKARPDSSQTKEVEAVPVLAEGEVTKPKSPKPRRGRRPKAVTAESTSETVTVGGESNPVENVSAGDGAVIAKSSAEASQIEVVPVVAEGDADKPKSPKPRRGRRPKAAPKETAAAESTDETATVDEETHQIGNLSTEAVGAADKPKSPKPRRGRRPKAAPKKTAAGESTDETVTVDEETHQIGNVSTEAVGAAISKSLAAKDENVASVPAEEEAGKPKSPKPRRGRRPKTAAKKKDITTDADVIDVAPEAAETTVEADGEAPIGNEAGVVEAKQGGDKKPEVTKRPPKEVVEEPQEEVKKLSKLLINAEEPEECRLALLEDGRLESINVSTTNREQRKNNIYKARIVAIEPSLQAAFVEYGTDKNGFLPFSEIHPEYFKQDLSENLQHLVDTQQWKKLSITDVVERGQDILAQVVKEEIGKKGANMTTFLSIPGRCVVLMPGSDSSGISRKISGEQRRSQLRETMRSMELPEGIGWIVRTASVDITQEALTRDVGYLLKLWDDIKGKGQSLEGVGLVYEEQHSVLRFLREHFDPSIQEILVDDRTALEQVKEFVQMLPKDQQTVTVRLHQGARPIFNQFSVEDQIESIYQPQVSLPSGGSIVIDPTEALVAIDVNSGSTSKGKNFEASIFLANMEAAAELARQLRLRDLGGLIVVDFIDMRSRKNIIAVEKQVRAAMKKDKAKVDFSRISKFGLMEISRQKLGAPIEAGNYRRCEHCKGRGTVRSVETLSLFYLRRIQTGASRKPVENIECHFPLDVAAYLLNKKRTEISEMEKRYDVEITINAETHMKPAENEIIFHKAEKETNNKKQA